MVLTQADTLSSVLAQQSHWFFSALGPLPRLSSVLCPSVTGHCSFQVSEQGSLARWGRGRSLSPGCCKALSSASKSASWGSSPTAAPETPMRLPKRAPEPGGSMSTVGSLFPLEAPLGPGVALARGRGNPAKCKSVLAPVGQRGRQPHLCPGRIPRCLFHERLLAVPVGREGPGTTQVTVLPTSVLHCRLLC